MKEIRALILCASYPNASDVTRENHVHNLNLELAKIGVRPTVLELQPGVPGIRRETFQTIDVIRFGVVPGGIRRNFIFRWDYTRRLRAYLEGILPEFDLINANALTLQLPPVADVLARKPLLVTAIGDDVYPTNAPRIEQARRRLLEAADLIMGISEYTLGLAAHYVTDRSKLRFIPVGIREDLFTRVNLQSPVEARRAHGLPADRLLILMACNLIPRKGVVEVVRAFAQARASVPAAFLVVVGKGPERARLDALIAELGLAEHVRITPYLGDDFAMAQHYRASDLYIMFSKTIVDRKGAALEGFGISYIDASAVGIPVIGGRSGGVPSAVVDGVTGFLVDPEGPDPVAELAARMAELLRDEALRQRMGRAGQERVFASLTWAATARQTRECYDAALAERGAV